MLGPNKGDCLAVTQGGGTVLEWWLAKRARRLFIFWLALYTQVFLGCIHAVRGIFEHLPAMLKSLAWV